MKFEPTHAMILAAGLGSRMRPLTDERPKPLVEVADRPLIDHVLDRLHAAGITDVVVNVHYLADMMQAHLARRTVPRVSISDETDKLMDSGGGLMKALPMLGDQPFITANSDSIWLEVNKPNLTRLIENWDESRMDALLLLAPMDRCCGYDGKGDFLMDSDGRLKRWQNHDTAPFAWSGVQIVSRAFFHDAPQGAFSTNVLLDRAIERGRLIGIRMDGFWMHVGTPLGRDLAERKILEQEESEKS